MDWRALQLKKEEEIDDLLKQGFSLEAILTMAIE